MKVGCFWLGNRGAAMILMLLSLRTLTVAMTLRLFYLSNHVATKTLCWHDLNTAWQLQRCESHSETENGAQKIMGMRRWNWAVSGLSISEKWWYWCGFHSGLSGRGCFCARSISALTRRRWRYAPTISAITRLRRPSTGTVSTLHDNCNYVNVILKQKIEEHQIMGMRWRNCAVSGGDKTVIVLPQSSRAAMILGSYYFCNHAAAKTMRWHVLHTAWKV